MKRAREIAQVVTFAVLAGLIILACLIMSPFLRLQAWIKGGR